MTTRFYTSPQTPPLPVALSAGYRGVPSICPRGVSIVRQYPMGSGCGQYRISPAHTHTSISLFSPSLAVVSSSFLATNICLCCTCSCNCNYDNNYINSVTTPTQRDHAHSLPTPTQWDHIYYWPCHSWASVVYSPSLSYTSQHWLSLSSYCPVFYPALHYNNTIYAQLFTNNTMQYNLGHSEIGTQYNNPLNNKGHSSRSQPVHVHVVLIHFEKTTSLQRTKHHKALVQRLTLYV